MKVLQCTMIVFFACLVLISCRTDDFSLDPEKLEAHIETINELEMLSFKANLSSVPNIDSEFITYVFSDSKVVSAFPKFSTLTGKTTYLGELDQNKSAFTVRDCSQDEETSIVESILDMTLRNRKGDGLRFLGSVTLGVGGPTWGNFEVIEGYGEFKDATGWLAAEGFVNIDMATIFLCVDGMVTPPNH